MNLELHIFIVQQNLLHLHGTIETAKNLLNMSLSIQDISKATGLSKETIEQLAKEIEANKT